MLVNCGREANAFLCSECRTEEILDLVYHKVMSTALEYCRSNIREAIFYVR